VDASGHIFMFVRADHQIVGLLPEDGTINNCRRGSIRGVGWHLPQYESAPKCPAKEYHASGRAEQKKSFR
jgi:hypothetical protein